MTNWHDKTLTEQSATCPVYGITWTVGDIVAIQTPAGWIGAGAIKGFRLVSGEIWADIKKEGITCTIFRTEKLSDLQCSNY